MRSIGVFDPDPSVDDRTTKSRIRDAAIGCFADHGIAETTARKVAAAAGVSPGLVMHHFGSMEGLRSACDEYVAATIRHYKHDAMAAGPGLDVLAALRDAGTKPLMGYLAAVLVDDSPTVAKLVDELVADAEGYMQHGAETGMVRPGANLAGQAAVLLLWSLGALVMHRHVRRILGVDLTDPHVVADPAFAAYAALAYEIMGAGIFTDAFAEQLQAAFSTSTAEGANSATQTPPNTTPPTSKETR